MCAVQLPTFGLLLKRHRRAAGMTQEELAERAGMSARAIGDLERDLRLPRRDTLQILLEALELAPDEESNLQAAAQRSTPGGATAGPPLQTGSFLGALPPGRLVARHKEVQRILTALDAVVGGSGRLVLLTGEPGIGKTRLAQECAVEAGTRGFLVATGRCYEQERDVPFQPFMETLATAYAAAPRSIRQDVPRRWPHLAGLLPEDATELSVPRQSPWTSGLESQQRLFRAVSGFLRAIADEMPVAILVDDLHWADDASLKLLAHLARQTRSSRVLLLGTYQDVQVDARHPLESVLVDLNRERLVERVVMHRLDLAGTTELIGETLGDGVAIWPELVTRVHEITNGNPFFIQEILRMVVTQGDLDEPGAGDDRRDLKEIPPPETVRAAIEQRLGRLPATAQVILRDASVLGQTFDFGELEAFSDRSEEELDEALEAALGMGLIREAGPELYAFDHALTQQALYTDMSQRRRQRLHLAAGEALERLPEAARARRSAELAWHFRAAGDIERAISYSLLAGDRAEAMFAYEDAQRHFRKAVELASTPEWEPSDPSLVSMPLSRLGRVLHVDERYDEALEVLEQAAELYRSRGDQVSEATTVAEVGWIHHNRRTDEQGIARLKPLVLSLRDEPPSTLRDRLLAILNTALARLYFGLGRYDDELAAAECATESAREMGDDVIRAVAEARRGAALMTVGRPVQAWEALVQAIALAEATENLGTMSVALDNLGDIACDSGDYREGRRQFERAAEVAEQTGLPGRMGWTLIKLGRVLVLMGEWRQARAVFERSGQLLGSDPPTAIYPRMYLAQLDLWEGDSADAAAELQVVMDTANPRRDQWLLRYGNRILAQHELLEGRPAQALERLAPLLETYGAEAPGAILLLAPLAQAYADLNREVEAEQTLAEGLERARAQSHGVARADLLRVEGILRCRQERWEDAQRALDEAINATRRMPDPYREAQACAAMAVLLAQKGDGSGSRDQLQEALTIARRIGARPFAQHVDGLVMSRNSSRT